ncbi:MAG TPA: hypothetical protein VI758_03535 [Bacteroidota bacterium]
MISKLLCSAVVLLSVLLCSCELTEPPPIKGNSPEVPPVLPVSLGGITPGQHVAGSLTLTVPDSFLAAGVTKVTFLMDTVVLYESVSAGMVIKLDLHSFAEGPHFLIFAIYDVNQSAGLLGLIGAPSRMYETPIIVDKTVPTVVQNVAVQWQTHPTITWQQSPDLNFRGFIVRKHATDGTNQVKVLDTLLSRDSTTFIDITQGPLYGAMAAYSVGTWNGDVVTYSNPVSAAYGSRFPVDDCQSAFPSPVADEEYVLSSDGHLSVVSTLTNTVVRQLSLSPNWPYPAGSGGISADGSRFYFLGLAMDSVHTMMVFDASSLTLQNTWNAAYPMDRWPKFAVGPGGTVCIADFSRSIRLADGLTGAVLDSLQNAFTEPAFSLLTTNDRNTLIFMETSFDGPISSRFVRYDVSTGHLVHVTEKTIGSYVNEMLCTPAGDRLAILHAEPGAGYAELLDLSTFNSIRSFARPADLSQGVNPYGIALSDTNLYMTYQLPVDGSKVIEIDLQTASVKRSWTFAKTVTQIFLTRNGKYLYAVSSASSGMLVTWILSL